MKKIFITLFFLSLPYASFAKTTVCLNMIVKNESAVIEKCLNSVKDLIDYWVIVDTGSTDGTQKLIQNILKKIPGELHEQPWIHFAHNRNQALALAKEKGDYLLFVDADEILLFEKNFSLPSLDKDVYYIPVRQLNAADIKRVALVKSCLNWQWKGVLHEVIESNMAKTSALLLGVTNICNSQKGARAQDPLTRIKDAEILIQGLKEEPENSRYAYYAGISYLAADEYALAQKYFQLRISMPSEDSQETYSAIYHLGIAQEKGGLIESAIDTYMRAYYFRQTRAEPLLRAAILYRKKGNILLGYLLSQFSLSIPYPVSDNCIEYMAYDHAILIEYANCALLLGKFKEGLQACNQLLGNPKLPEEFKERVIANRELAKNNL
jgi:glycosyltransferase involved in cell wall biosynthesis